MPQPKLTPAQEESLRESVEAELARRNLLDFCQRMDPKYERAAHIDLLISHLEQLERREIRKLIVTEPPRHSKSYHVSERFPAWYIGRHPDHPMVIASYGAALAERQSGRVRNLVSNPRYPFTTKLNPSSKALARWETTDGGEVVAPGVGGALTGFGGSLVVVDDPFKNRQEADSQTRRDQVWEWWLEVVNTRLMPDAVLLVTQTRWHEDDLVGRILAGPDADEWTVLHLPSLAEDDDPLDRPRGEALWPERYDREHLENLRELLGTRSFTALYQQRPTAEEGGLLKRTWMDGRYQATPPERAYEQGLKLDTPWHIAISVDSSWDEGVEHDYSVISTWGTDLVNFYLLDVWRERVQYPDLKAKCYEIFNRQRHVPFAFFVESAANGRPLIQDLRASRNPEGRMALPVVGVYPQGSKQSRVAAISPIFEAGRILLPERAPWLEDWIEEHLVFPNGAYDDQVDTTALALSQMSHRFNIMPIPLSVSGNGVPSEDRRMSPRLRGELNKRIERQTTGRVARVR